jgi:hypothetical protein
MAVRPEKAGHRNAGEYRDANSAVFQLGIPTRSIAIP